MISNETAVKFISEILGIDDVELKLDNNKLSLLNEIIRAHHQYIPFQNLCLFSTDEKKRCASTQENCINESLEGIGGLGFTLNGFFVYLLQALGFNAYLVSADISRSKIQESHLVIIVCDIEESEDKYYVDVGFALPTFAAIPLHTLEDGHSDIYHFACYTVCLTREGDKYSRYHKKNIIDRELSEDSENEWEKHIEFESSPRDLSYFDQSMTAMYTDKNISQFLDSIFLTIYPPGKAVTFQNLTVKIWDEDTDSVKQLTFDSTEKAIAKMSELFPMIPLETIKNGFDEWSKSEDQKNDTK